MKNEVELHAARKVAEQYEELENEDSDIDEEEKAERARAERKASRAKTHHLSNTEKGNKLFLLPNDSL